MIEKSGTVNHQMIRDSFVVKVVFEERLAMHMSHVDIRGKEHSRREEQTLCHS